MVFTPSEQFIKRESLDDEEQQRLKDSCKNFVEKYVVNVLVETGLRKEELLNLCTKTYMEEQQKELGEEFNKQNYNVINWQANEIKVYGKMPRQKKKKKDQKQEKKRRIVPISSTCKIYLEKFFNIEENNKLDYTPEGIWVMIKRIAEKADIKKKVGPHILRHTFAVNWIKRGGNLGTLQRILGHASLQTTGIYLTMTSADIQKEFMQIMK